MRYIDIKKDQMEVAACFDSDGHLHLKTWGGHGDEANTYLSRAESFRLVRHILNAYGIGCVNCKSYNRESAICSCRSLKLDLTVDDARPGVVKAAEWFLCRHWNEA